MKKFVISALLLVSAFPLSLSAQIRPGANKSELETIVNTFFGFVKANDVDKIKSHYTVDYTFTDADGKLMNADERLQMLKNGTNNTFLEATELTVRTYGSAGLATGIATTRDPSGATVKSRFLQVWVSQGERWRLAASQITSLK